MIKLPDNPKKGDYLTFVKKCPYRCSRGHHTVIGQWNGSFWDYGDRVRHCQECGFHGETVEVREVRPGDEGRRDLWIPLVGKALDAAKDAALRDGKTHYLKCVQSFIPRSLT